MSLELDVKGQTVGEGSTGFAPLPAGEYLASVYNAELGEYKKGGLNEGRPNLNVQFRISDGQKGANRRLFQLIGLFPSWAPKPGKDAADNFLFFQFLAAVTGKTEKEVRAEVRAAAEGKGTFSFPDLADLLGKEVTLVVKIEADSYAYQKAADNGTLADDQTVEDFKRNAISAIRAPKELVAAASSDAKELIDL